MLCELLFAEVPRRTHSDAERLRFVRARNDTTIVVREYDNGPAPEVRLKQPLARRVEVVAVDKGDGRRHPLKHPHHRAHAAPALKLGRVGYRNRLVSGIARLKPHVFSPTPVTL